MSTERRQPLVSVVMPVHDRQEYVGLAMRSVLEQSHSDIELIVVDDRSSSSTLALVHQHADDRTVVLHSARPGVSAARNTALDVARGTFVMWQDSDDLAAPCRVERLLAEFSDKTDYAHSDLGLIDGEGRAIGLATARHVPADSYLPMLVRFGNPLLYPSMLLRRAAVGGLRFDEGLTIGEDMDFARRVIAGRRGVHVPEPLLYYRRHGGNSTDELTTEMVAPSIERMIADEPLEHLTPEVFTAYEQPDAEAVGRAVLALKLALRGSGAEAVGQFVAATSAPATPDGQRVVSSVLHLASNEPRQALDELRAARETSTTRSLAGECLLALARPVEAAAEFRTALELDPRSFDARSGLATASRLATDPSKMSIFRSVS